jgi:hypothetical protein
MCASSSPLRHSSSLDKMSATYGFRYPLLYILYNILHHISHPFHHLTHYVWARMGEYERVVLLPLLLAYTHPRCTYALYAQRYRQLRIMCEYSECISLCQDNARRTASRFFEDVSGNNGLPGASNNPSPAVCSRTAAISSCT